MKENIIINYLLLEQILRITGTYKNVCNEHEFLPEIFKQAKTGDINSLFQDDNTKDTALGIIENLTGVPTKYWSGQERVKLGIRCKNKNLIADTTKSIDAINLSNDDGTMYKEIMNNPLNLDHEEVYLSTVGLNRVEVDDEVMEQETDILESLYSLKGLITVLLINMEEASDRKIKSGEEIKEGDIVQLIDKANIYIHSKWKPYIRFLSKPTEDGITYCPKYVEIRSGLVQTVIKSLLNLGYIFTFRDLGGDIVIKNDDTKENEYKIKEFKI
jgi:hypothetical protein